MRISIDIGYGFVKAVDEKGNKVKFPSALTEKTVLGTDLGISARQVSHVISISENEVETIYYVGNSALTRGAPRSWNKKGTIDNENVKVLLATAIKLLNPDLEAVEVLVGLPISHSSKVNKKNLREFIKKLKISIDGKELRIIDAKVYPQGLGAYYSNFFTIEGREIDMSHRTKGIGTIDIGFRTTDFILFALTPEGPALIDELNGSLEKHGLNTVLEDAKMYLENEHGLNITQEKLDGFLQLGNVVPSATGDVDLTDILEHSRKRLASEIASNLKKTWADYMDFTSRIIVTGGGGMALFEHLKEHFPSATLQDDAEFANSKGYFILKKITER